jgi:hypothetical protein
VTVTIQIRSINDVPVAVADRFMVLPGTTLNQTDPLGTITPDDPNDDGVLANDSDAEGTPLQAILVKGPTNAAAFQLNSNGTFTYTPKNSLVKSDSFTYRASDGDLSSDETTVTIIFNVPPVAVNDSVLVERNVPKMIDVLANDSDAEGKLDPASIVIVTAPAHGVAVPVDGEVRYTPDTGYLGSDSFTYTVADEHGARTNVATVQIQVLIDPYPWQNSDINLDVNADGDVSPMDALLIINHLNFVGSGNLPIPPTAGFFPPPYLDVSGDNAVTPIDAIMVINYLNRDQSEPEGEFAPLVAESTTVVDASAAEGEATPQSLVGRTADGSLPVPSREAAGSVTREPVLFAADEVAGLSELREGVKMGPHLPADFQLDREIGKWDDLIEDIADDIAGAHDDELIADLALNNLLYAKRSK